MNVLQHTRNELNLCLKQNRSDRSYRDTLLISVKLTTMDLELCYRYFNHENTTLLCEKAQITVLN